MRCLSGESVCEVGRTGREAAEGNQTFHVYHITLKNLNSPYSHAAILETKTRLGWVNPTGSHSLPYEDR